MLVKTYGGAIYGERAHLITIEVQVSRGVRYHIVGMPDVAVKESLQRIEQALLSAGFKMPRQKIVVNLSPAYLRKEGSAFDLPIAMGILAASKQLPPETLADRIFFGELSLAGEVLAVKGLLPVLLMAAESHFKEAYIPVHHQAETRIFKQAIHGETPDTQRLDLVPVNGLREVVRLLKGGKRPEIGVQLEGKNDLVPSNVPDDFSLIQGQAAAKRALEIAAAGHHNVLLFGPPGAGKTMLAKAFAGILPPMTPAECLAAAQIYSIAGKLLELEQLQEARPFRSPHHTVTPVTLVGGGQHPMPGEISLAHHGVLFLDELPEFKRAALEVLRQPIEMREMIVSRGKVTARFPANFLLIASMNPCPCGYAGHLTKSCSCKVREIRQYLRKISGPLLDRVDIYIQVAPIPFEDLVTGRASESSAAIRARVVAAREIQRARFQCDSKPSMSNAQMEGALLEEHASVNSDALALLKTAMERLHISARGYFKILKVARTIADLAGSTQIEVNHVAEAIQWRSSSLSAWME